MQHRQVVGTLIVCSGFALFLTAGNGLAQQKPADPNRPLSENIAKVNLAEVGLMGGAASVTRFTYAPGKAMPPHTHTGRTSIIVIVQGQLTERRGETVRVLKAGDVATVAEGATHANENAGSEPLIYVEINITGPKAAPPPAAAATTK
jgi:quercetin dioxygenase-like cupin family protein